jgi:hypothetical protein
LTARPNLVQNLPTVVTGGKLLGQTSDVQLRWSRRQPQRHGWSTVSRRSARLAPAWGLHSGALVFQNGDCAKVSAVRSAAVWAQASRHKHAVA